MLFGITASQWQPAPSGVMQVKVKLTAVNQSFTIPTTSGVFYGNPNFVVNWGDGSPNSTVTSPSDSNRIHAYIGAIGDEFIQTYTGIVTVFSPDFGGSRLMIKEIISIGNVGLKRFNLAGCSNCATWSETMFANVGTTLVSVSGLFNGSGITGTSVPANLFAGCTAMLDMTGAFTGRTHLTGQLPVNLIMPCANVTTILQLFIGCTGLTGQTINLPVTNTLTSVQQMYLGNSNMTSAAGVCSNAPKVSNYSDYITNCTKMTISAIDDWLINVQSTNTATGTRSIKYQNCGPPTGPDMNLGHLDSKRSPAALTAINNMITAGWVRTGTY